MPTITLTDIIGLQNISSREAAPEVPWQANTAILEKALRKYASIGVAAGHTLTQAEAANARLLLTGTLTADRVLTIPGKQGWWLMTNGTAGAHKVTVTTGSGATVDLVAATQGETVIVFCDGTNVYAACSDATTLRGLAPTDFVQVAPSGAQHIDGQLRVGDTGAPSANLHAAPAAATTPGNAPLKLGSAAILATPESGAIEYNGHFSATESDLNQRYVVQADSAGKITAGAPYTNDGYVTIRIGGVDVKVMTTA